MMYSNSRLSRKQHKELATCEFSGFIFNRRERHRKCVLECKEVLWALASDLQGLCIKYPRLKYTQKRTSQNSYISSSHIQLINQLVKWTFHFPWKLKFSLLTALHDRVHE